MSIRNAQKKLELEKQINQIEEMIIDCDDLINELQYKKHKLEKRLIDSKKLLHKM